MTHILMMSRYKLCTEVNRILERNAQKEVYKDQTKVKNRLINNKNFITQKHNQIDMATSRTK